MRRPSGSLKLFNANSGESGSGVGTGKRIGGSSGPALLLCLARSGVAKSESVRNTEPHKAVTAPQLRRGGTEDSIVCELSWMIALPPTGEPAGPRLGVSRPERRI